MDESGKPQTTPTLPAWKAFVVQFTADPNVFAGRVEHMYSGQRARFASPEELIVALRRLIDESDAKA